MAKTCLVLGGNGFVGAAVVRAAAARGWDVTPAGKTDLPALAGTSWDAIINANGNSKKYLSDREPLVDFELSVASVAASLHQFKTSRYVFLSTVDVYPDKSNPANNRESAPIDPANLSRYGFHKWLAEQLVMKDTADWLILRMAGFVGNGLKKNPIYDLLTGAPLRVHPDSAYQFQDTDRLAGQVFDLMAAGVQHEVINTAGDGTVSLREVADMISGSKLPENDKVLPKEHYEISIERMKSFCTMEPSRDAVRSFIAMVRSGEKVLS